MKAIPLTPLEFNFRCSPESPSFTELIICILVLFAFGWSALSIAFELPELLVLDKIDFLRDEIVFGVTTSLEGKHNVAVG